MQIVDGAAEKIVVQHSGRSGKSPQSAGAFRAAQITGGGGLK